MPNKIIIVPEGIIGNKLGQKIGFYLSRHFDIKYQKLLEIDEKDAEVALYILNVDKLSDLNAKVIKTIRMYAGWIPILFISGHQDLQERIREKVEVIEIGADEYLSDSQTVEEIAASVKALIRRHISKDYRDVVHVGKDFRAEQNCRKVFLRGREIFFTKTEFDIVYYLALNAGKAITYKELYEAVWEREYLCDDRNIMAHIHRIRKKMEEDSKNPVYIQTVYGIGYCFADIG